METPNIPDAETAAAQIEPLPTILWEALEHGIEVARLHFGPDKPIEASLGSHLVRYHAREFLLSRGIMCETVPLNGIAFRWSGYYLRVLKSDDGILPVPGTERKKNFYQQKQMELFPLDAGEAPLDPEINLVVLWDAARGFFTDLNLKLACPKTGGSTRESVEAYWYRSLLHPTQTVNVLTPSPTADDANGLDLDIRDLPDQKTGDDDDAK